MSLITTDATPFENRQSAGRALAGLLTHYAGRSDVIVLGLPRGGVPVAFEVTRVLQAPLDVLVVRKLGVPGHDELAMGAIAGGVRVLNDDVVRQLNIPERVIDMVAQKEQRLLEQREQRYRNCQPALPVRGRIAILVDDGLATGATMHAAIEVLRQQEPARIIVAVPAAARETCEIFSEKADEFIAAIVPEYFYAVGAWYEDFTPVTDEEVSALLERAADTK